MVFHFAQAKQKWKNFRNQGGLTLLAPLHQTPSCRITLLFAARARDSKVSLLAGYTILKFAVQALAYYLVRKSNGIETLGKNFHVHASFLEIL